MATAPHIFTLTGNLLAERTLEFARWEPGRTQRATQESFQVGGKGINVSKMLTRLRAPNTALCFTGGASGAECESWLRARRFNFRSFPIEAATRVGTVVRSASGAPAETTFLGPDVAPDAHGIRSCAEFIAAQPAGQILALCGSFPGWTEPTFDPLRDVLDQWLRHGILVADTYGPPLAWLATRPLALLKVNAHEFAGLAPTPDALRPTAVCARWIVTDGAAPVRFWERGGAMQHAAPPPVREISPTGSGDVLLACVLVGLFNRGMSLAEAVRFALPYAAANAAHAGIAEFPEPGGAGSPSRPDLR